MCMPVTLVMMVCLSRTCCVCPAAKRSAPIPVMVEEVDMDDGSFSGEISLSLILWCSQISL